MSDPLVVGIDPHRKTNTVCMMDRHGDEVCDRFTVQNNRPGTDAFVHEVALRVVIGHTDWSENGISRSDRMVRR